MGLENEIAGRRKADEVKKAVEKLTAMIDDAPEEGGGPKWDKTET